MAEEDGVRGGEGGVGVGVCNVGTMTLYFSVRGTRFERRCHRVCTWPNNGEHCILIGGKRIRTQISKSTECERMEKTRNRAEIGKSGSGGGA